MCYLIVTVNFFLFLLYSYVRRVSQVTQAGLKFPVSRDPSASASSVARLQAGGPTSSRSVLKTVLLQRMGSVLPFGVVCKGCPIANIRQKLVEQE
jgi:hypothetical protein